MTRRLLGVLLCSVLVFAFTLRADPPTPPVAKNTPARSTDASPDEVRRIQDKNAREYKQFEELLLRLAIRMERGGRPEDKDKAKALGTCLVACRPPGEKTRCVGPSDQSGCDCETACYKQHMPDGLDVAKAAGACYHKAVAPSCQ